MIDLKKLATATRVRRGHLTLREAAEQTGVSFGTIARVERGGKPDLDTFTRLCRWIGVEMEYFLDDEPESQAA